MQKNIKKISLLVVFLSVQLHGYETDNQIIRQNLPSLVTVLPLDTGGKPRTRGCGFFIDHNGSFVTTAHTVEKAHEVLVTWKRQTIKASYVRKFSPDIDLVVVASKFMNTHPAHLGDSSLVTPGEAVVYLCKTTSSEDDIPIVKIGGKILSDGADYIHTTEKINPKCSGSPLINGHGDVIGVITPAGTITGDHGQAVPINLLSGLENANIKFKDLEVDIKPGQKNRQRSILDTILNFWVNHSDGFSEVFTKSNP